MVVSIITPIEYPEFGTRTVRFCYSEFLDNENYREYHKLRSSKTALILDYSPTLPRITTSFEDHLRGIEVVNPSVVILPSVDFSYERTIKWSKYFSSRIVTKVKKAGVLQGYDLDTLDICYRELKQFSDLICLPSPLEKLGRREEIVRDLNITTPYFYLEVFENPYEEIPPPSATGIFTSYPIRLAADLREIDEYEGTPPALDYRIKRGRLMEDLVMRNIKDYMDILSRGRKQC